MNDPQAIFEKRKRQVQKYVSRMPSLSTTVTKVTEICNSPSASPNDLNRVISLDPVLTGKVLKLINSAYYSLPNQVTSMTRAIIMLGLNTIKNLALSTAVLGSLSGKSSFQAFSGDQFWTHSICVGVTAKALAGALRVPTMQREEYFVAGLLHDLGKIPLNDRYSEEYVQVREKAKEEGVPLLQVERAVLGIDHCDAGAVIGEKWQLSEAMCESLRHHHDPQGAQEANRKLVATVALADTFTNVTASDSSDDAVVQDPRLTGPLERLGVEVQVLLDLRETVAGEIEKAKLFLQVSQKG